MFRPWQEIDGPFLSIRLGSTTVVAYNLIEAARGRSRRGASSALGGHKEAIIGVFTISGDELAELLNEYRLAYLPPSQATTSV